MERKEMKIRIGLVTKKIGVFSSMYAFTNDPKSGGA
jgi:hypothetical protein